QSSVKNSTRIRRTSKRSVGSPFMGDGQDPESPDAPTIEARVPAAAPAPDSNADTMSADRSRGSRTSRQGAGGLSGPRLTPDAEILRRLDDYELYSEIARGGMGV